MNRMRTIVCGAVTVTAIAAGYFLPELVLSWQDWRISEQTSTYAVTPVHFFSSRQISDTLLLLSDEYTEQSIMPSYSSMNEGEVYEAAESFLRKLIDDDVLELDIASLHKDAIAPSLVFVSGMDISISEDQSNIKPWVSSRLSAIIWNCSFSNGNSVSVRCSVDDATGLVTSVSGWIGTESKEEMTSTEKEERIRKLGDQYTGLLKEYYGFAESTVHYGSYPDHAVISLQTTDGQTIDFELTVAGSSFSVRPIKNNI